MTTKVNFNLFFSASVFFLLFSCKPTQDLSANLPQFTKVENLARLNIGMSKKTVLGNLENVYPHDILNGTGNCEIHEYFYLKPQRSVKNSTGILKRDQLTSGDQKYSGKSKACIVYKNSKLSVVYTNVGLNEVASLLDIQNLISEKCKNELIVPKGCTDPSSLSFDPKAMEDDGSCEYCDCGMLPNPGYNSNRPISDCNSKCISEDLIDENGNVIKNINADSKSEKCDNCDLIDALVGSDVTIQLNLNSKKSKKNSFKVVDKDSQLLNKKITLSSFSKKNKKKKKTKVLNKTNSLSAEPNVIKVY